MGLTNVLASDLSKKAVHSTVYNLSAWPVRETLDFIGIIQDFIGRIQDFIGRIQDFNGRIKDLIGRIQDFIGRIRDFIASMELYENCPLSMRFTRRTTRKNASCGSEMGRILN